MSSPRLVFKKERNRDADGGDAKRRNATNPRERTSACPVISCSVTCAYRLKAWRCGGRRGAVVVNQPISQAAKPAVSTCPLHHIRCNMSKQGATGNDDAEDGSKSLRTTLYERNTAHATDLRKRSLFQMVDADHSGTIDQAEFSELYDVVREETEKELMATVTAQRSAAKSKRKSKILACAALVLSLFLVISVSLNFAVMFYVVDTQVCACHN